MCVKENYEQKEILHFDDPRTEQMNQYLLHSRI